MLKKIQAFLLTFFVCPLVIAGPPFFPEPINNFLETGSPKAKLARLKVSITLNDAEKNLDIRLGGLVLCSEMACFRPNTPSYVDVTSTQNGTATIIADAALPFTRIVSAFFDTTSGQKIINGNIQFETPLNIERGDYGGEVLIVLSKKIINNQSIYYPTSTSGSLINEESKSIFYNPKFPTSVNLSHQARLFIPVDALNYPQIFIISVHDVSNKYPLVDIYPYVSLKHSATLEVTEINQTQQNNVIKSESVVPRTPVVPPVQNQSSERPTVGNMTRAIGATKVQLQIPKTGTFTSQQFENVRVKNQSSGSISPNSLTTCEGILSSPANLKIISDATASTGVVNINWCENIPPYVHMIFSNLNDPRIQFSIPYTFYQANVYSPVLMQLKPISAWMSLRNSIALINGFTWSGDQGTSSGQTGLPDGYLTSGGNFPNTENIPRRIVGGNRIGGGSVGGPGTSAGNKYVMGIHKTKQVAYFETSAPDDATHPNNAFSPFDFNVVSSSTSIVKRGTCTGDMTDNRWSAVGAENGRMVIISSTSNGTTSAAKLCPLFKALQVNNALRLDGGPSTSITLDGKHLNPLIGLVYLKYGSARYIAYPLRISW